MQGTSLTINLNSATEKRIQVTSSSQFQENITTDMPKTVAKEFRIGKQKSVVVKFLPHSIGNVLFLLATLHITYVYIKKVGDPEAKDKNKKKGITRPKVNAHVNVVNDSGKFCDFLETTLKM